jgi:hypothetical protein
MSIQLDDDCHGDHAGRLIDAGLSEMRGRDDSLLSWHVIKAVVVEDES